MTAAELRRDLVEALPTSEFWTPKLHTAEQAARAYIVQAQLADSESMASIPSGFRLAEGERWPAAPGEIVRIVSSKPSKKKRKVK